MVEHNFKKSLKPQCPPGYILRDEYQTKSGKVVPARCIKKTGVFPGKAETVAKKIRQNVKKEETKALKLSKEICSEKGCRVPTSCPPGQILRASYMREGYTKKSGTKVKPTVVAPSCIKNLGAPGHGKKLITLNPADHFLSQHGYEHVKDLSLNARHTALKKTIKDVGKKHGEKNGYLYVIRALTARANLGKRNNPQVSAIFQEDQKWVSQLYKNFKK